MGKHTPGPWAVLPYYNNKDRAHMLCCIRNAESGNNVVDIIFDYDGTPFIAASAADAALICAAPDLLAVLMEVEKNQWECEGYCQTCGNGKRSGHAHDCALTAAIKKAVGEQ